VSAQHAAFACLCTAVAGVLLLFFACKRDTPQNPAADLVVLVVIWPGKIKNAGLAGRVSINTKGLSIIHSTQRN